MIHKDRLFRLVERTRNCPPNSVNQRSKVVSAYPKICLLAEYDAKAHRLGKLRPRVPSATSGPPQSSPHNGTFSPHSSLGFRDSTTRAGESDLICKIKKNAMNRFSTGGKRTTYDPSFFPLLGDNILTNAPHTAWADFFFSLWELAI